MTIASIPARGGSRRIPRKNVKLFCGHPLVAWSIWQAKNSKLIDKVLVSTDDDEIAEIAKWAGADVVYRRHDEPELAQGGFPTWQVVDACLSGEIEGYKDIEHVVSLLPTSPCRHPWDIDRMIQKHLDDSAADPTIVGTVAYAEQLETVVFKETDEGMERIMWAKNHEYYTCGGGMGLSDVDVWTKDTEIYFLTDAEIDANNGDNFPSKPARSYTILKQYQNAELDLPEHWDITEAVMRLYILPSLEVENGE